MVLYQDAENYPWGLEQQRNLKKRKRKKKGRKGKDVPFVPPTPFPTPNPTLPPAQALISGPVSSFLGVIASVESVESMTSQEKLEMCINLNKRIQEEQNSGKGKGKSSKPSNLDPSVLAINMVRNERSWVTRPALKLLV